MRRTLLLVIVSCILGAAPLVATAQPSVSIEMAFRLFDKHGRRVPLDDACNEYTFLVGNKSRHTPCPTDYMLRYDDSTGYFLAFLEQVYAPFELDIVWARDTMAIVLPNPMATSSLRAIDCPGYVLDSLVFTPGTYMIIDSAKHGTAFPMHTFPGFKGCRFDHCDFPAWKASWEAWKRRK